jgi:acetyl-CoA carboxylase carboxyl transferase subunit alpha
MARSSAGDHLNLPFEKPVVALEKELAALREKGADNGLDLGREIREKQEQIENLMREIFSHLTPFQRVQLARHPLRPTIEDYVDLICDDSLEFHGDRNFGDDRAILTTLARIGGHRVMVVGHRKGPQGDLEAKQACNFGMPNPEGYRKAILKMRMAERFDLPIVCLVDTPGAFPGIEAEERGQAWAIAENIQNMTGLRVPIVVAVIGEGGSGGALGIGVGDRVLMMENSYYSVITPEGCAAILWKTAEKAADAAAELSLTATDLARLGIVDDVVPEPLGGAHRNRVHAATALKQALVRALHELGGVPIDVLLENRYGKFRKMGQHLFHGAG